jgi:hypothetical protein
MCAESMAAMPPKDLTTRVVVPQPEAGTDYEWLWKDRRGYDDVSLASLLIQHAPFSVGDPVALTETWRIYEVATDYSSLAPENLRIQYHASAAIDGGLSDWVPVGHNPAVDRAIAAYHENPLRWHPSMFMPADLARRFGTITSTSAGRLHDMTDADYIREGVPTLPWFKGDLLAAWIQWWDKLDGHRYPYASNPWVYHYGYELAPSTTEVRK